MKKEKKAALEEKKSFIRAITKFTVSEENCRNSKEFLAKHKKQMIIWQPKPNDFTRLNLISLVYILQTKNMGLLTLLWQQICFYWMGYNKLQTKLK